ncbi:MAG TPA: OmpA family protein [Verrucomicrobiae bacterium]
MPKLTWIIASVLSVAVLVFVLGLSSWQQGRDADRARAELAASRAALETNSTYAAGLNDDLAASRTRIAQLQKEKEAVTQAQKNLEQEMRAALESKDITISQLQGRLTVNILDRILFDSGEAVLKPDGEAVLQKLAGILAQYPNRQIHVVGHTDNVPIRPAAQGKFGSNWELSTARATAAVRFLSEKAAVDPRRLGAVGYGEFHPVADNNTAEGRARNRRIALVVLPEELAGVDAPRPVPPGDHHDTTTNGADSLSPRRRSGERAGERGDQ